MDTDMDMKRGPTLAISAPDFEGLFDTVKLVAANLKEGGSYLADPYLVPGKVELRAVIKRLN